MKISCRMSHPIVRVHHVGAGVIAPAPFLSLQRMFLIAICGFVSYY